MYKIFVFLALVSCSYGANKVKFNQMTLGNTVVSPEFELELSDPKPYDWKNQPTPKPYLSEFKIATPDRARQEDPEIPQKPQPFSFGFMSMAKDGTQSRQESQDDSGKVTGSYTITDANGITRVVEYYADDTGFHANIKSNEPGLENGQLGGAATISRL